MSDDLKPCRELPCCVSGIEDDGTVSRSPDIWSKCPAYQAWNLRSGEGDKDLIEDVEMGLRLLVLQSKHAALGDNHD